MIIEVKEVKGRILEKLPRATSIVSGELEAALQDASTLIWQKSIETAPASIGVLRKSIMRDLYPTYSKIYPTVQYGLYVHEGTRPHWPPLSEIKSGGSIYRWAQKKGIPPFLVAKAIAKKGTKAQPWMAKVAKDYAGEVQEIFIRALAKAVEKLV